MASTDITRRDTDIHSVCVACRRILHDIWAAHEIARMRAEEPAGRDGVGTMMYLQGFVVR